MQRCISTRIVWTWARGAGSADVRLNYVGAPDVTGAALMPSASLQAKLGLEVAVATLISLWISSKHHTSSQWLEKFPSTELT